MKIIQPYSNELSIKSLDYLQIDLELEETSECIPLTRLIDVAIRKNKKRAFLFVSKILGKHLAVDPKIPLLGGILLAYKYGGQDMKEPIRLLEQDQIDEEAFYKLQQKKVRIKEPTLFIGFAETATGLGHSLFASCEGNISYIHTTREMIVSEKPSFTFEEVHSHATGHQCFTEEKEYFQSFKQIVLVDDEITTGHTALHLIEALHRQSGNTSYRIVSILDWRSEAEKEEARVLERKLGVQIEFISLIQGKMMAHLLKPIPEEMMALPALIEESQVIGIQQKVERISLTLDEMTKRTTKSGDGKVRHLDYMKADGRFGLGYEENRAYEEQIIKAGSSLKTRRKYETCLVIGTEEFIYIPCLLASCMGEGVSYQSSTRSPIIPCEDEDYPIRSVLAYKRPEDQSVINYLYNIRPDTFEEAFWIMERIPDETFMKQMAAAFKSRGFKKLTFVTCDGNKA